MKEIDNQEVARVSLLGQAIESDEFKEMMFDCFCPIITYARQETDKLRRTYESKERH